jgi:isopenicillin-N N-acyltransferase like protein
MNVIATAKIMAARIRLRGCAPGESVAVTRKFYPISQPDRIGCVAVAPEAIVECRGSARECGRAHGEALREAIGGLLERWDADVAARLDRGPRQLVADLVGQTGFVTAIGRHTPHLLEEVRGIADAAGVAFDRILALNLMDEEWWFSLPAEPRDACSVLAVAGDGEHASLLAQNMDLPEVMDGAQAILRWDDGEGRGGVVLTAAGMIGLTGVNAAGLGVCVNTLPMLNHSPTGLPVAFVLRGLLERPDVASAGAFLEDVPHASGQHYALADSGGVAGYECSAGGAVRSDDGSGGLCHTNHPLRSSDLDPAHAPAGRDDSHDRLEALEGAAPAVRAGSDCERVLADRDTPLCVIPAPDRPWITFGSIWAELGAAPRVRIAPGPPDRTAWTDAPPGV